MIVERLHANYALKGTARDPRDIQRRFDHIAGTLLVSELEQSLARLVQESPVLSFIRRIDVDLAFAAETLDDRRIARIWAEEIALRVAPLLPSSARESFGPFLDADIAVFRNRAQYLAHFVDDLLTGTAWGKWYYRQFADLCAMSRGAVVTLVFRRNREIAEEILYSLLERGALDRTLWELPDSEVREIFSFNIEDRSFSDARSKEGPAFGRGPRYETIIRYITDSTGDDSSGYPVGGDRTYGTCLKIYLQLLKRYRTIASPAYLKRIVHDYVFGTANSSDRRNVQETSDREDRDAPASTTGPRRVVTSFGGLFLLIPSVFETGLIDLLNRSSYPEGDRVSRLTCFLYHLALSVTGQRSHDGSELDPGIGIFAGLKDRTRLSGLARYPETVTTDMNEEFLNAFVANLRSFREHDVQCGNNGDLISLTTKAAEDFPSVTAAVAEVLLKTLARRFRGFERSSPHYIFRNFIQRYSEIEMSQASITVRLARGSLDLVLRMSGLVEDIDRVPWLEDRSVRFILQD